jgi:hypothetical protein
MSDTPRTDAEAGYYDGSGCWKPSVKGENVDADFARTLERELAAAKAEVEALRAKYNDLIMCVGSKHPGDSRHDTAKRYLIRAETLVIGPARGALAKEKA